MLYLLLAASCLSCSAVSIAGPLKPEELVSVQTGSECDQVTTACECAELEADCGWSRTASACESGSKTDCYECPTMVKCASSEVEPNTIIAWGPRTTAHPTVRITVGDSVKWVYDSPKYAVMQFVGEPDYLKCDFSAAKSLAAQYTGTPSTFLALFNSPGKHFFGSSGNCLAGNMRVKIEVFSDVSPTEQQPTKPVDDRVPAITDLECKVAKNACSCAKIDGCGWSKSVDACLPGSSTSCKECPEQHACQAEAATTTVKPQVDVANLLCDTCKDQHSPRCFAGLQHFLQRTACDGAIFDGPPSAPRLLTVAEGGGTRFVLIWLQPKHNFASGFHHYYVSVRSRVTSVIRSARLDDATLPVVVVDGLVPGAAYEINVYAQNKNGRSTSASTTLFAR